MSVNVIAIDGPAGTGKSSTASEIAKRLDFKLLDTGALYRSITYVCLKEKIDFTKENECAAVVKDIDLNYDEESRLQHMFYKKEDITKFLRASEINSNIGKIAGLKSVRDSVVLFFQKLVKNGNNSYVVEGRDIGSVIFPDACCKIFLTADPTVRAHRRALQENGGDASKVTPEMIKGILESVKSRDASDTNRRYGPLIQTADAVLVDTSEMEFPEVVEKLVNIAKMKFGARLDTSNVHPYVRSNIESREEDGDDIEEFANIKRKRKREKETKEEEKVEIEKMKDGEKEKEENSADGKKKKKSELESEKRMKTDEN